MKFGNYDFLEKLNQDEEQKAKQPLSSYSMNTKIFEDNPNKTIKVYDESLFDQMKAIKIKREENKEIEQNLELKEKLKKKEKEKEEFESYISKMKNIISDMEANTNEIKISIEEDQRKKEELRKKELARIEMERKRIEEEEKRKLEEERIKREQERIRIEQERLRKLKEEQERQRNINGINVKERLIKAGKNYKHIEEEVEKVENDNNLSTRIRKVAVKINDLITKYTSSIDSINKAVTEVNNLFNEMKQKNYQTLFLYANHAILNLMFLKLDSINWEINYENLIIDAKMLFLLNNKTLTYMFFQRVSNKCPYIIPMPYIKAEFDLLFKEYKNDFTKVYQKCRDAEYFYFIFLYLDINKYITIVEDYITNIEKFTYENMNFLITSSFYCFLDVFGNYIWRKNGNWINRIIKIKENVVKGLENEGRKVMNTESDLVGINQKIGLSIEKCLDKLIKNQNTDFMEKFLNINRV